VVFLSGRMLLKHFKSFEVSTMPFEKYLPLLLVVDFAPTDLEKVLHWKSPRLYEKNPIIPDLCGPGSAQFGDVRGRAAKLPRCREHFLEVVSSADLIPRVTLIRGSHSAVRFFRLDLPNWRLWSRSGTVTGC